MTLAKAPVYLLDVNVVLALLDQAHVHNQVVEKWFDTPDLQWALCAFTEAGVVQYFTRPKTGDVSMEQATSMLASLKQQPGYHFQPILADWQTLTAPFSKRLHGYRQVTDAYLLGLAVSEGLTLATFDKAILHMAGEHSQHVLILEG
jgi:predicted nucleic acid-binding protein